MLGETLLRPRFSCQVTFQWILQILWSSIDHPQSRSFFAHASLKWIQSTVTSLLSTALKWSLAVQAFSASAMTMTPSLFRNFNVLTLAWCPMHPFFKFLMSSQADFRLCFTSLNLSTSNNVYFFLSTTTAWRISSLNLLYSSLRSSSQSSFNFESCKILFLSLINGIEISLLWWNRPFFLRHVFRRILL